MSTMITIRSEKSLPPHRGQAILHEGAALSDARAVLILVHGRGASAANILGLSAEIPGADLAYFAPQASGSTWYPKPFMTPIAENEPGISSAMGTLSDLESYINEVGIPSDRIVFIGFSQGASLSLEYAARNAKRYGAIIGLSGALIGPDGTPRDYGGKFDGTPVFLGCSDVDFHIPRHRVELSAEVFEGMGADVDLRLYPNFGHAINEDELDRVRQIVAQVGR